MTEKPPYDIYSLTSISSIVISLTPVTAGNLPAYVVKGPDIVVKGAKFAF